MTRDSGSGGSFVDDKCYGWRRLSYADGSEQARIGLTPAGVEGISFGPARDVSWYRKSAGVMATESVIGLANGTTAERPSAATVGIGIWFDRTLGKPIFSDGFNWKLADGTAA